MDLSEVKHLPKVDHTPAKLDEASLILLQTAAYIEKHGHCQNGNAEDASGAACVIGAMTRVVPDGDILTDGHPGTEACDRIDRAIRDSYRSIPEWSDKSSTADVLAKLRAVALGL